MPMELWCRVMGSIGMGWSQTWGSESSFPAGTVLCTQVDLAVVEVGIGGAFDCTNIIR